MNHLEPSPKTQHKKVALLLNPRNERHFFTTTVLVLVRRSDVVLVACRGEDGVTIVSLLLLEFVVKFVQHDLIAASLTTFFRS